jgi:hypothetical protein
MLGSLSSLPALFLSARWWDDGRLQGVRISSLSLSLSLLVSSVCSAACGRSVPELLAAILACVSGSPRVLEGCADRWLSG